jgi:hypothetical protein
VKSRDGIETPRTLELRSIDVGKRRYRQYNLSECRSLFDEPSILIAWGRIGRVPRVRVETFKSPSARKNRWGELLVRRNRHAHIACACESHSSRPDLSCLY